MLQSVLFPAVSHSHSPASAGDLPTLGGLDTGELSFVLNGNCPHPKGAVVQETSRGQHEVMHVYCLLVPAFTGKF